MLTAALQQAGVLLLGFEHHAHHGVAHLARVHLGLLYFEGHLVEPGVELLLGHPFIDQLWYFWAIWLLLFFDFLFFVIAV